MESQLSAESGRLNAVLATDGEKAPDSEKLVAQGEIHAEEYALSSMKSALDNQVGGKVIQVQLNESQVANRIQEKNFDEALTQHEANWLRKETGAYALLKFGITDYGMTPKAWRKGYITFEVTSTLAIAGIIAYSGSTAAKAAAGAYLAQEAVEEAAEAYAGFWALDVVNRPVRIVAKLIQLDPLETVWEDSDTGLSDTKLSRLTRKAPVDEKYKQLDQSTDDAVRELASELSTDIEKLPGNNQ